ENRSFLPDMDHKLHFRMDVAADLEGARLGKALGNILARGPFVAVEIEAAAGDIDLMDEVIIVGESQRIALVDGDFAGAKRPPLLHDDMRIVRDGGDGCQAKEGDQ